MNDVRIISIVMLNFNGLKYLEKTIPPILELDYPNFEFIIVDNGSTDGSIEFIKSFTAIKLIENGKNLGYSKGKNIGVQNANGDYVLMIDNDIVIQDRNIISRLVTIYNSNNKIGLIQVPLLDIGHDKTKYYGIFYTVYGQNLHQKSIDIKNILGAPDSLISVGSPCGGCMFFRKSLWDKIGGFDESQKFNIDDIDIGPRFYMMGYKNYLYTRSYFTHLGVKNNQTGKEYSSRFSSMFSGQMRSFFKNLTTKNLILIAINFYIFQLIKSIRYSFKKKTPLVYFGFFYSNYIFLKNLPDTLQQRRIIQSSRTITNDLFLKIKPPKL